MENKYFTPNIEDFHVGYEYEHEDIIPSGSSDYFKSVISKPSEIEHLFQGFDVGIGIRVPYLTREQIEAEGWYKINNNYPIQTFKHPINVNVEVIYNYDTNYLFITIPGKIMFTEPKIEYRASKFSGKCKDINTFRKICKLLEI